MEVFLSCDGWEVESRDPPMRWDDHPAKRQKPINTSFPVLFLGNSHDPVTPLFAAVKMATKFAGSGLVEQRSEGHCTLAAVSLCTIAKIRAYLNEGKVPPPPTLSKDGDFSAGQWDVCEANEHPWKRYTGPGLGVDESQVRSDGTVGAAQLDYETYKLIRAFNDIGRRILPGAASGMSPLLTSVAKRFSIFLNADVELLDEMLQLHEEGFVHRRHLGTAADADHLGIL